jgi:hypothetical protein
MLDFFLLITVSGGWDTAECHQVVVGTDDSLCVWPHVASAGQ